MVTLTGVGWVPPNEKGFGFLTYICRSIQKARRFPREDLGLECFIAIFLLFFS